VTDVTLDALRPIPSAEFIAKAIRDQSGGAVHEGATPDEPRCGSPRDGADPGSSGRQFRSASTCCRTMACAPASRLQRLADIPSFT